MIRRRYFDGAGDEAVSLLRRLKPYPGGNIALRAIHDLDIRDKHTSLIPTPMAVGSPVLSRWDDDSTPNLTIVGDATAPSQLTLAFPANGPLAGQEILPTLQSLIELTAGIVEAFRTLASE
jgi:hypothetical protein